MKRLLLLLLTIVSCQTEKSFEFEVWKESSGILIKNYEPMTREDLIECLTSVNDTLMMDSINVYIMGENIEKINKDFHRDHFIKWLYADDTLDLPKDIGFAFGIFKGHEFFRDTAWDEKFLKGKFLKSVDK